MYRGDLVLLKQILHNPGNLGSATDSGDEDGEITRREERGEAFDAAEVVLIIYNLLPISCPTAGLERFNLSGGGPCSEKGSSEIRQDCACFRLALRVSIVVIAVFAFNNILYRTSAS